MALEGDLALGLLVEDVVDVAKAARPETPDRPEAARQHAVPLAGGRLRRDVGRVGRRAPQVLLDFHAEARVVAVFGQEAGAIARGSRERGRDQFVSRSPASLICDMLANCARTGRSGPSRIRVRARTPQLEER